MPTAFLTHPLFPRHEMPPGHPERSERVTAIAEELEAQRILDRLVIAEAPAASRESLRRVHSERHVSAMESLTPGDGLVPIDADTWVGSHSLAAAKHAAGAAIAATDLVVAGDADNAFCCVRPPGHHAERDRAMGFCLFNNVAVGAAHALERHGLERVAILDFDVHHGNGTEDIFAVDDRVLFCSSFQDPFYPNTPPVPGGTHVVRTPLARGADGAALRDAVEDRWAPTLDAFSPEMIFVSAGFDGHVDDDMAGTALVDDDYRWITAWIREAAARHSGGRIVSCLEGGYALPALARCATLHVRGLADL